MKERFRHTIPVLVLFALLAFSVFANASEQVTIVFYHRGYTTEVEWVQAVIERFEELHPHIKVESLSSGSGGGSEFSEKLTVLVAGGTAPDVFYGSTDKLGFILKGWTMDLTSFVERDAAQMNMDDFFPGVMDSFTRDGQIHGIPLTVTPQLIFYNKDMFAEAGLVNPPADWNDRDWTWDTFLEVSRKLTISYPDGAYAQLALSTVTDMQLPDISWMFGGDWFPAEAYLTGYPTHSTMLTDENVAAYEAVAELYNSYAAEGRYKGISSYYGFGRGQIAMDWIGAYKLNNYVETQRSGGMQFEWGLAATPLVENRLNTRWTDPLFISSTTQHAEAAWEFVKFATGEEGQRLWAEITGKIPARQSVLPTFVESMAAISGLSANEIALAIGGALENGRTSLEETIAELPLEIFNNRGTWIAPMLNGSVPVRTGLAEMDRALNAIIAERGWNTLTQ